VTPVTPERRSRLGLPAEGDDRTPTRMMIELNLNYASGLEAAEEQFRKVWTDVIGTERKPTKVSSSYYAVSASLAEATRLVERDQGSRDKATPPEFRCLYKIWPDFTITRLVDRSVPTIKADAALRAYGATGQGITWAVVDSGIDRTHPHFATYDTLGGDAAKLHRDFTQSDFDPQDEAALEASIAAALTDEMGHGTHVAGIIAGSLASDGLIDERIAVRVAQRADASNGANPELNARTVADPRLLSGAAPKAKLVSLKVLSGTSSDSTASNVLRALRYVREVVNGDSKIQRIQGVNLSVGYEFDARWFACGQSPICVEVDRLVRSGVVVVVAAGNTGYGDLTSKEGLTSAGLSLTINDPGNAALAITVGATHRDSPHTYGVSYFSSKGPTGDGRMKPDLVAPGERITSCAAGPHLAEMQAILSDVPKGKTAAAYIDDSGTSMAAPHVSGAAAEFLSIRREFIGRPEEIKRILMDSATSLGREAYFQGRGLVDVMRAIQSI
jgi:subtilisin family serine protease